MSLPKLCSSQVFDYQLISKYVCLKFNQKTEKMKTRILRYLKHIFATIFILAIPLIMFGLWHGASLHYDDHPLMMTLDKDGPYVFYPTDSTLTVNYVRGNKKDGFYVEQTTHPSNSPVPTSCHFQIDSTNFALFMIY